MSRNKMQVLYSLLQGLYWVLFGITIAFVNTYLTGLGIGTDVIGLVTAVFAGLAALSQAFLGKIADKKNSFNWKSIMIGLLIIRIIMNLILMTTQDKTISTWIFGIAVFTLHTMLPFVSTANFYYAERGIILNYGLARGVGSLFFGVATMVLGIYVSQFGIKAILIAGLIASILLMIILIALPYDEKKDLTKNTDEDEVVDQNFFVEYPIFSLSLLAFVLIMTIHNNISTYLLQIIETVGGTNKELGNALFLAAIAEIPVLFGFSYLHKRFKTVDMILFSTISFAIKLAFYMGARSIMGIYVGQIFQLSSFALFISSTVFFTEENMKEGDSQKGQSMMASAVTLGSVMGSLSGGYLIKNFSVNADLVFMLILSVLSFIIMYIVKKKSIAISRA